MSETSKAPAGWYPHPSMPGTQQYWDGLKWTEHIAPAAAPTSTSPDASGLLIAGWICAFTVPPAGFVIAMLLPPRHGAQQTWMLIVSIVLTLGVLAWVGSLA
jgi:hypothetical protein